MRLDQRLVVSCASAFLLATAPAVPAPAQQAVAAAAPASAGAPHIRIDNFARVNDQYYRGAQPHGSDYADLAALGVRTVIDLQTEGESPDEARAVEAAGMRSIRIPMTQHVPPTAEQTAQFLAIVNDPAMQPVYVHCRGGRHRTGVMTAVYRMQNDGWSPGEAFQEMKHYRFGLDILHREFKSFVLRYTPVAATPGLASASRD
jgi:protein tyrosine/serine phosphatase